MNPKGPKGAFSKLKAMEKALDFLYDQQSNGLIDEFHTSDIVRESERIMNEHSAMIHGMNGYDSLSGKHSQNHFSRKEKMISLKTESLRELFSSSCAEYLPEYWNTLNDMKEKLIATEVFNRMRDRLCK